ncbi:hypothetical protein CRUP_006726, partial [Coryphaenoides rupestris]
IGASQSWANRRRRRTALRFLEVGNLGLLFMLLFFIYAALGVELFGELGDNWNGIMKDTLRECPPDHGTAVAGVDYACNPHCSSSRRCTSSPSCSRPVCAHQRGGGRLMKHLDRLQQGGQRGGGDGRRDWSWSLAQGTLCCMGAPDAAVAAAGAQARERGGGAAPRRSEEGGEEVLLLVGRSEGGGGGGGGGGGAGDAGRMTRAEARGRGIASGITTRRQHHTTAQNTTTTTTTTAAVATTTTTTLSTTSTRWGPAALARSSIRRLR